MRQKKADTYAKELRQKIEKKFGISITAYNECRIPYEQQQDYTIDFD